MIFSLYHLYLDDQDVNKCEHNDNCVWCVEAVWVHAGHFTAICLSTAVF